jgi:hypothetical protein
VKGRQSWARDARIQYLETEPLYIRRVFEEHMAPGGKGACLMLPLVTAVRYVDEMASGATRPCLVTCVLSDGSFDDYVMKMRSEVRASGLTFEYIAACLAQRLGIEMPAPVLINLPFDVALAQSHNPELCDRLTRSVGLNFGTRYLPGLTTWPPDRRVPMNIAQPAAELIAFDGLIDNPDRRRDKPNVLVASDRVVAIDHELAFAFLRLIAQPPTWLERLLFLREHPFYAGLRGHMPSLEAFKARLANLEESEIDEISGSVPREFPRDHCARIAEHLKEVRAGADRFIHAIEEVLR